MWNIEYEDTEIINEIDRKAFHIIFEQSKEMIFFFHRNGKIYKINQIGKEILGNLVNEPTLNIADIFKEVFSIKNNEISFLVDDHGRGMKTMAYPKDHIPFMVDLKSIIEDENGEYIGMCMASPISDRKMQHETIGVSKAQLEKEEPFQNEFLPNIIHELRTPLNGIIGISHNLLDTQLDKLQLEDVHIIEDCCTNMNKLINELLDISKMKAGKFTLNEDEFNFFELMEELMSVYHNMASEKNIKLIGNISKEIPELLVGDALRISQIIHNVMSNGMKFTKTGYIAIDVIKGTEYEDRIRLDFRIRDTGIGISKENIDKLFISYSQADASITPQFGGTGLGLAISKELVQLMNGDIYIESELGKGSAVFFTIELRVNKKNNGDCDKNDRNSFTKTNQFILRRDTSMISVDELDRIGYMEKNRFDMETKKSIQKQDEEELQKYLDDIIRYLERNELEKAEITSGLVKKMLQDKDKKLRQQAFRLELSIRKEDKEGALKHFQQLRDDLVQ